MAKKKKDKTPIPPKKSFSEIIGLEKFLNLFRHEKINFVVGILLLVVACFMFFSFVSFFTSGSADVSCIESPKTGEMANTNGEFSNYCGSLGAYCAYFFVKQCFGFAAFCIPLMLVVLAFKLMQIYNIKFGKWFLLSMLFMVWASIAMSKILTSLLGDSFFNPGGDHGLYVCRSIENVVGEPGLIGILAIFAIAFLTYLSNKTIIYIRKFFYLPQKLKRKPEPETDMVENEEVEELIQTPEETQPVEEVEEEANEETAEEITFDDDSINNNNDVPEEDDFINIDVEQEEIQEEEIDDEEQDDDDSLDMDIDTGNDEEKASGNNVTPEMDEMLPYDPKRDLENYRYPTLDLLKKYDNDSRPVIDMEEQTANKDRIVNVLRNFGVEISSIKATVGPTITLYEITPAPGVRISKIRNLEDDIALSLSALGIRIIAPIPGKGTIGIEVPNAKPSIVSMESILNSKKFQETTMDLPCAIGKTITNEVYMFDLAKAPHLLVAGATGQGKSVGLNAIITSLLYKKHPAELKIVLVDPKKVEFSVYANIDKHFLAKVPDEDADPIITDVTKVVRTLNSLCKEMDTRYDLLKSAQVRNLKEYNKKFIERRLNPEKGHRYLPYIVVIIDEFGDLIMTAGKEVELPIARIAQLARAVGIHMIIATQRPTTNIITGTIKANFPSRIAFRVGAMIDSRTILDKPGAQQLVGRGDMLYLNGGEPVRVQCAFVDTPEVERINGFIANQQGYPFTFELPEPDMADGEGSSAADVDMKNLDALFEDAARLIVASQSGSTSLIQRKFSIGFNRAGRLMDQLEKAGIVGIAQGSKPREVLIQDENSLNNLFMALRQ